MRNTRLGLEKRKKMWYTNHNISRKELFVGLLSMCANILSPSDDHVFNLILTRKEAKLILIDLFSSILRWEVIDVEVWNPNLPDGLYRSKFQNTE